MHCGKFTRLWIHQKISGKGAVRTGKEFTLFIAHEDMDDTIRIKESLEDSGLIIGGATETAKHKIKKKKDGFFLLLWHLWLLYW